MTFLALTDVEHPRGPPPTLDDHTHSTNTDSLKVSNAKKVSRNLRKRDETSLVDQLSDRAQLGATAVHSMKFGDALSDQLAVQLIVERLR